ncbi:unnamed protein product [Meloidogyne enterolobii]|uniref:Uncharacterized protein n=1 Tax=Meloidogyne enterolobii TaxID=390850 RepID=A0ACB0Z136_MELEN
MLMKQHVKLPCTFSHPQLSTWLKIFRLVLQYGPRMKKNGMVEYLFFCYDFGDFSRPGGVSPILATFH